MTTINYVNLKCPGCAHEWKEAIHPSICTWLNPELITKLFEEGSEIKCPECSVRIRVMGSILINHPGGMFFLELGMEHEKIKQVLIDQHVVSRDGDVTLPPAMKSVADETYL